MIKNHGTRGRFSKSEEARMKLFAQDVGKLVENRYILLGLKLTTVRFPFFVLNANGTMKLMKTAIAW